jgi:hypothetical protein
MSNIKISQLPSLASLQSADQFPVVESGTTYNVTATAIQTFVIGSGFTSTGNVTGGNILTGGLISATGNVTGGNLLAGTGIISTSGRVTGGNITTTGTVTGGSLATGGTASATGTITGGNIATGGTVSATGTITGPSFNTANFSIIQSGTKLYIQYNGANIFSIDSTGNITAAQNVTAYGTP